MFIAWQQAFGVSYAELGLAMALMSGTTAVVQAPVGFLVDQYGARRFLVGGTIVMTLSIAAMGLATAYWQIALLAMLSAKTLLDTMTVPPSLNMPPPLMLEVSRITPSSKIKNPEFEMPPPALPSPIA